MLQLLVVLAATVGLIVLAKGLRGNEQYRIDPSLVVTAREDRGDDLPCPWCYGPTQEHDTRCRGCGRRFG